MGRVWGGPNNVDPSPEWRFSGLPKPVAIFNFGPENCDLLASASP